MATRKNLNPNKTDKNVESAIPVNPVIVEIDYDSDNPLQYEGKVKRQAQGLNRVTFTSGKTGVVRVLRLIDENVAKVNRINEIHGFTFIRVYVADYRTEFKGESLTRRLGAIGIVESDNGEKRAYLLGSTWQASIKTRGESQKTLDNMLATVQKAIHLASTHGLYDEYNMSYDNVPAKDNGTRAFVNADVSKIINL